MIRGPDQVLKAEIKRLENLCEWEKTRRIQLEGEVVELKDTIKGRVAQRRRVALVEPW